MQRLLERIVAGASGWIELRYQARSTKRITVRNGGLEESSSTLLAGLGVRALVDGVFGFASTTDVSETGILAAIEAAQGAARTSAGAKKARIEGLADAPMAKGTFAVATDDPLDAHPLLLDAQGAENRHQRFGPTFNFLVAGDVVAPFSSH